MASTRLEMAHLINKAGLVRLNAIEFFIIVFYAVSPFMYLVRVLLGDSFLSFVLLRTMQPLLILVVLFGLLVRRLKYDLPAVILFSVYVYGVVVGAVSGNNVGDLLPASSHFLLGFVLYLYFYNVGYCRDRFEYFSRCLLFFSVLSVTVVILLMYMADAVFGVSIYLGLACQVLLFLFFYGMYRRSVLIMLACVALIFLSGKRGVLVALVLTFSVSFIPLLLTSSRKLLLRLLLVGFCSLFVLAAYDTSYLDKAVAKMDYSGGRSVNDYSSGRYNEVLSVLTFWSERDYRKVFGAGFGYTYTYHHDSPELPNVTGYKNVHFSYLNPLILFGIPIGGLYIVCFFAMIIGAAFNFSKGGRLLSVHRMTLVAFVIYACFAFVLFTEPFFWMLLGLAGSLKRGVVEKIN